jgi:hypothetical protein
MPNNKSKTKKKPYLIAASALFTLFFHPSFSAAPVSDRTKR